MRLRIFRRECGGLLVSGERIFGLAVFKQVTERKPGARLTFFSMVGGFESGGGTQESLALGVVGAREHQAQVQIGFEDIGLGGDGLPVGVNRVFATAQAVEDKSKIKPSLIVLGIAVEGLLQQSFGRGKIIFLDGVFRLSDLSRLLFNDFAVMADGGVGLGLRAGTDSYRDE